MTPFAAWRARLGLSKSEAAQVLGLSRNSVIAYETGRRPLPRHVALACAAVEGGIAPIYFMVLERSESKCNSENSND